MASATASKEYKLAVKIAGSVSSSFNNAMGEATSKMTGLGEAAKAAAAVAAAAWGALKIGQFISDATDTYMGFEQSMAQTAATAGATGEQYEALRQAALEMGKATSKTAAESADALGYMALAGWNVSDSIASLEPILRLSEATQMDLARCSDLVTDSMSALGLQVSDLSGYLDVAAQANNKSNQTAKMLMEAYIGVGGTMKNLNVPIQQSAAALGVLANRGIKGGEAGNALNAVMINLTTGAGQAGKMMEKLGISAFDSSGKFIGLQETIQKVYEATKDMTEAERNAALAAIGGKQHTDALNALMSGLTTTTADGVTEWNALADSLYNSQGAMATMAATVTDTWQGAKARLDSAIDDLKINLVSTFAPYAKDAINGVAEFIPRITEAVTAAGQSFMESAMPKVRAFASGAKRLFVALQPTIQAIGSTATQVFSFVSTTVGNAITAIGQKMEAHRGILDTVGRIGQQAGQLITDAFEAAKPVLTFIAETALPAIVDGALTVIGHVTSLISTILEFKEIVAAAGAVFAAFKAGMMLQSVIQSFRQAKVDLMILTATTGEANLAQMAMNGTMTAWQTIVGLVTGKITLAQLATALWTKVQMGLNAAMVANPVGLIIAAIAAVIAIIVLLYTKCEWFRNGVHAVINAVVGFFKGAATAIAGFFSGLWSKIQAIWSVVAGWFQTNVIQPLVNFFTPIIETVSQIFRGCWIIIQAIWVSVSGWFQTNVITPLVSFFSSAVQAVSGFFSGLWTGIQGIWQTVSGWFQTNVIQPLVNFFAPIVESIGGFFSNLWANIVSVWQAAGSWFQENVATPIQNAFQAVSDFVRGIFNGLIGFVEGMINRVIGGINSFVGGFSGIVEKAASFLGVEWDGIGEVPEVTLPRLAKGGIVDNPTVLEAGEAGTEAIIPLSELWGQMQGIFDNSVSGLSDRIASLAEQLNAADMGSKTTPLADLLGSYGGGNDGGGDPDGNAPLTIYYQPVYHFEGGAPDQDDLTNAEHISQDEFDRRMAQYLKHRKRTDF